MLAALIDPLGLGGPRRLDNDSFIALRAGTSQPFGVVVIAGTGTVAAGRDPTGRTFRTFGLEPMYGDFGSATDVAEEAVHAVADAYKGRGPATTLSELLPPLAGCSSPVELLQRLSRGAIPLPLAAPLVLQEAAAGGLFRGGSRLLEATLTGTLHRVAPHARPVRLGCKPVVGAVIEALELAGAGTGPAVRERLVASFPEDGERELLAAEVTHGKREAS
jgi:hypothetical protein